MRAIMSFFAIAVLCSSLVSAAEKPVHVFILSGQSNMAGMDPKLGFEPEAKKLFPKGEVVYFKVARGGQPIRYWVPEWPDIAKKHNLVAPANNRNLAARKIQLLEFAILANERDHATIIKAAKKPAREVKIDGKVKARWMPVARKSDGSQKDVGDGGEVISREVTRRGKKTREYLVIVHAEAERVTNANLKSASATTDDGGRPMIGFEFDADGAKRMNKLTSDNQPKDDGFRRRLAVVQQGQVDSAPFLQSVIGSKGVISGDFTKNEVNRYVALLNAAMAPERNDGTKYYQPILDEYTKVLKAHGEPTSVTFCWMQGERDAKEKLDAAYKESLKQLIANLRKDLKQPNMNFVIGRLSDFGKPDYKEWENVRKVQVELAEEDKLGSWVDCDDLNNKTKDGKTRDDLHYTKEGYELLGRRYARQAKLLIDGKKPVTNGRPE